MSRDNAGAVVGLLFSMLFVLALYAYFEPPFWALLLIAGFVLIATIEQLLDVQGLFGGAAGLLLIGGGVLGFAQNEAIVLSSFAIILGIGIVYRNISLFEPFTGKTV